MTTKLFSVKVGIFFVFVFCACRCSLIKYTVKIALFLVLTKLVACFIPAVTDLILVVSFESPILSLVMFKG